MRLGRPRVVGGAILVALLGAVGFVPLFGGPGYENALATGLVAPSAAAIVAALEIVRRDVEAAPVASVRSGVAIGVTFAALAYVVSLVHGVRVGICELWGATLYFALTAGAGTVMGGAWGALVGEGIAALGRRGTLARLRAWAVVSALAAPIGGVLVSLARFHGSPMVFAFDPFVGYFSGTLYDTVIDAGTPLLTYRLGSALTLASLALAASVTSRSDAGVRVELWSGRAALAALFGLASLGTFLAGASLGHMSTPASIAEELGGEKHGARCDVIYPETTREADAALLVKDCDEQLRQVEARLGVRGPARVRAWFFRDADEKKRLMGAAHTYIAKPWREEVYLQLASYPHPVLGHELAHIVAGAVGRGPFRIAGALGGLVPNPGLIEGIAVFGSPGDDALTERAWAHAMLRAGLLPPMQRVFSFGFLADASSKSYTLAGAFVAWLVEIHGQEALARWYGGAAIEAVTGSDWAGLDREFRAWLEATPLAPEAESFANARFGRPGLFARRCPHVVDAMRAEADGCRDSQRYADAVALYERVLGKDPNDWASRLALAVTLRRYGTPEQRARGEAALEDLASAESTPRLFRDRATEALGDAELADGAPAALASAGRRYDALAAASLEEDAARTFEVKAIATRATPDAREAIARLLLGDEEDGTDPFASGLFVGAWARAEESGLAEYLAGRNLIGRGFLRDAGPRLDRALTLGLPTARLGREALRQRAVVACALGEHGVLTMVRARIEAAESPFDPTSEGRRRAIGRLLDRCE